MDNNKDFQAFKTEFDMLTRRSTQFADKLNRPKFIDTAERCINMLSFDMSGVENWHLPFPKLALITGNSIVSIGENDNKYMDFHITKTDTKQTFSGSLEIHRNGEKPQDIPIPQKHFQTSVEFNTEWRITIILKVIHAGKGQFFHGCDANINEKGIACGALLSLVNYFYPFCVNKEMFVVESQAAERKKGKTQTRGKSTYSVMHVTKVLKHFTPTGQPGKPLTKGFPRRAHIREYRHDKWTNMKGQTIIVKSTWVGPKTVLSEGRLYKVHTDIH